MGDYPFVLRVRPSVKKRGTGAQKNFFDSVRYWFAYPMAFHTLTGKVLEGV